MYQPYGSEFVKYTKGEKIKLMNSYSKTQYIPSRMKINICFNLKIRKQGMVYLIIIGVYNTL